MDVFFKSFPFLPSLLFLFRFLTLVKVETSFPPLSFDIRENLMICKNFTPGQNFRFLRGSSTLTSLDDNSSNRGELFFDRIQKSYLFISHTHSHLSFVVN